MPATFLAVGHLCHDVTPNGYVIGGSASYSTITARNLGYRACAVTAVGADFNRRHPLLDDIEIIYHDSPETTIFDNRYGPNGRRQQFIRGTGGKLVAEHIPETMKTTEIIYLCPIADEVDAGVATCFKNGLIGVTPQGWMRQWDKSRQVRPKRWETAEAILTHADVLVLSDEDISTYPDDLKRFIQWTPIVILTKGARGATLYENGNAIESAAYSVTEVDPTGAGDVFAAAFLIGYHKTGSLAQALNFAHCTASFAVEGKGTTNIPTYERVAARLRT